MRGRPKSILIKNNRRSCKKIKTKSVSFKKKIVELEVLIPRVGKSKKLKDHKKKKNVIKQFKTERRSSKFYNKIKNTN